MFASDLKSLLEPEAFAKSISPSAEEAVALSTAISLKRIADALSNGGIFKQPINSYGEGIGDAIQGQLVRGQAGISQYDR